jgi:nitrite reductase/ring-hydroxylating ferredoxin subunit
LPVTEVALGRPAGRSRWVVQHAGRAYAVFVRDGAVTVTDARCPHRGGPLAAGWVRDGALVCPWHWYTFDLGTGQCRTTGRYRLRLYPVTERDGELFAEIDDAPPTSWSALLRAHARGGGP